MEEDWASSWGRDVRPVVFMKRRDAQIMATLTSMIGQTAAYVLVPWDG
jgi:hypothetical protein